jgi:hypothetical protein
MRLEKMINPLLDDDDLTALTYIFSEIMEKNIKSMQAEAHMFFYRKLRKSPPGNMKQWAFYCPYGRLY